MVGGFGSAALVEDAVLEGQVLHESARSFFSEDFLESTGSADLFAQTRAELVSTCGQYNSMSCNGPIGDMMKSHSLAFHDVPIPTLFWSSRPLTALFTRRWGAVLVLCLAVALLHSSSEDFRDVMKASDGLSLQYLRVENLRVFENVFPELSDDTNYDIRENRRLRLRSVGVYFGLHHLLLVDTCNTSLIADSGFEVSCRQPIRVHGFWVHVSGSSKHDQSYDWAGLQYSWCGVLNGRCSHNVSHDVRNQVFGTGHWVRGEWNIVRSVSRTEGVYRQGITAVPWALRSYQSLIWSVCYAICGLCLLCVAVLASIEGKAVAAKKGIVFSAVIGGGLLLVPRLAHCMQLLLTEEPKLAHVLLGLPNGVAYGTDQVEG